MCKKSIWTSLSFKFLEASLIWMKEASLCYLSLFFFLLIITNGGLAYDLKFLSVFLNTSTDVKTSPQTATQESAVGTSLKEKLRGQQDLHGTTGSLFSSQMTTTLLEKRRKKSRSQLLVKIRVKYQMSHIIPTMQLHRQILQVPQVLPKVFWC